MIIMERLDLDKTVFKMDEYFWVLPQNDSSNVPIGARILAKFGHRIKIRDDDKNEYWVTPENILRPMHPTSIFGVEDMTFLGDLREYSILRNLQIRYTSDRIYTYIGSILVAVNPYKPLPIYGKNKMAEYRRKRLGELEPHIFAVADYSYESMRKMLEKRCIVISGESGAGKTESMKLFLVYFATISRNRSGKEEQILESNPILEAFGNAKTVCNDNSSRFGKYISIIFNTDGSIHSAKIKQYLLEKSRIVFQNKGEQNYHIFYSLLNGLTDAEKYRLKIKTVSFYNYLNNKPAKNSLPNEAIQVYNLKKIKSAMKVLNFSEAEIWCIFEIIAAILHFGNVQFQTVLESNLERVSSVSNEEIKNICSLLQVTEKSLVDSLTKKTISTHGENVVKFLSEREAINSRDAFVKKIFGNLFNFIVEKINVVLFVDGKISDCHIGILDIFGFEAFDQNSFEQICINYANERLQQFFIRHAFKTEQEQYATEGINWKFVEYPDNTEILNLIETEPKSILSVINDATKIPKGTDQSMLDKLIEFHSENPFFLKPKYKSTPVFGIQHFAGIVLYDTKDFVEKNRDACSLDIKQVVQGSRNDFLKNIFCNDFEAESNAYFKKRMETLASKFKNSLDLLMNELNECQPFFVRCIKPNEMKKPEKFDRMLCSKQLKYSGMMEVTKIREAGYPARYDFFYFVQHYRVLVPEIPLAHKTSCKEATLKICQTVFKKFSNPDYKLGRTKIFLKHAEEIFLEVEREKILHSYALIIQKLIRGWLVRRKLLKLKKAVVLAEKSWLGRKKRLQGKKIRKGFHRLQSKLKSRQLLLEFQHYRRLIIKLQAYCRGYSIRTSLKNTLKPIKDVGKQDESADFTEFAKKYFQDNHNHRFSRKPLKSPLTRLVQNEEVLAAKAIWLTILRYTGNILEPGKLNQKIHVCALMREILKTIIISNGDSDAKDKEESERPDNSKKVHQLYEDWLKTRTTNLHKLHFVIAHGIKRAELRDEIYCQICKILTKNPSKKAARRAWDLLSCCVGCFPPSDLLLKYLKSFIRQGQTKYSSFCLFRLHRTIQNGFRTQPPFSTELEAIKQQKPVNVDVGLMNGCVTSVKIDSATTTHEMVSLVARNVKLEDTFGFSLVLGQETRFYSLGNGSGFVLDAVSEYEQYATELGGNLENMQWKFYLKKEMFAPWHDFVVDEVATNLIYHQIKEGVVVGEYGYNETNLPALIAQICYAEKGKLELSALNQALIDYVPLPVSENPSIDLEDFKEEVKVMYQKMFGKNQRSVNSTRAEIVKYAANNWAAQFSRFFNVVGSLRNSKSIQSYPDVPLTMGVNSSGIFIIDESNEKRIIGKMNYMEIREVSRKEIAKGQGYILKIMNYEGMELALTLLTPVDMDLHRLLIKIIETIKKYSKFVMSIKNYKTLDESFLVLQKGDLVTLSDKFYGRDLLRNSWAEGLNNRTKKIGNFLLDCVEIIPAMEEPPEITLKAIKEGVLYGKRTPFICHFTEKLKHYSLESYADKFFRDNESKGREEPGNRPSELWKYSVERLQKPLHFILVNKEKEARVATEIFENILRYTEHSQPLNKEEELVSRIFEPGLENNSLRDEIYCQIMKQLTYNPTKESENKTWELMWMLTRLFPCGQILALHVKKFLQSRRTIQIARECLTSFYKISSSEQRKHPPHVIEIEAVKNRPCKIFHRVYFPDGTHKFFQVNSLTKFTELKEAILTRLKINSSRKGFCLLAQISERLFSMPEDYYMFDYLQILKKWTERNKMPKTEQYKFCLMKYPQKDSTSGNNKITNLQFLFPQEYNKYIQGYYEIPAHDLIQIAGLLYKVFFINGATQHFQKILEKLVPLKAINSMKTDTQQKQIEACYNEHQLSSVEDCKIEFLKYLNKFSLHSLPYFTILPETPNLKNYMFYLITSNSQFNA